MPTEHWIRGARSEAVNPHGGACSKMQMGAQLNCYCETQRQRLAASQRCSTWPSLPWRLALGVRRAAAVEISDA
eukprot:5379084-Pleurochrysis_carterae.AAC.1